MTAVQKNYCLTDTLKISEDGHFFMHRKGRPFFWLSCWGWHLASRYTPEMAETFLELRERQGFNVVMVPLVNQLQMKNIYGFQAFTADDPSRPAEEENPCGFWNHVEKLAELAEEWGLCLGLIPLWGRLVENGFMDVRQAREYGSWLGSRFRKFRNIIWIIGGDAEGRRSEGIWRSLGRSLRSSSPGSLISFHPGKKRQSSRYFHDESWMDFNMFQSGCTSPSLSPLREQSLESRFEIWTEKENWRPVMEDTLLSPAKPTLDGETGPESLNFTSEDIRRSAYWSVFAGAAGYCCPRGNESLTGDGEDDPAGPDSLPLGGDRLVHLKNLMLSVPFLERKPAYSCLQGDEGVYAGRLLAAGGRDYLFIYCFLPRKFTVRLDSIEGEEIEARWFNPRTGKTALIGLFPPGGTAVFTPPAGGLEGEDWVLILSDFSRGYFR